ncbi:hypothetical protein GCM10010156_05780 [Planobispora rosea]|uniref:Uncharacterized protein n=1 Tax=Planobispora rosea TaxID=35762 RepID=A0A8J3S152_PLARO|nr:hypothetical protein GCM10010156_05780 [Planobispora rosea]GIH83862.1 hypothetical protein Pro02_22700 [Planobispora rosea]
MRRYGAHQSKARRRYGESRGGVIRRRPYGARLGLGGSGPGGSGVGASAWVMVVLCGRVLQLAVGVDLKRG